MKEGGVNILFIYSRLLSNRKQTDENKRQIRSGTCGTRAKRQIWSGETGETGIFGIKAVEKGICGTRANLQISTGKAVISSVRRED